MEWRNVRAGLSSCYGMTYFNPALPILVRTAATLVAGMALQLGSVRLSAQPAWSVQPSPTQQDLWGVCYGTEFVAVGDGGTIIVCQDGISWAPVTSGTTNWLLAVACSGPYQPLYVAVGDQGTVLYSQDNASTWAKVTVGTARLNGVAYGYGRWLAVGEGGAIARSTNGVDWTAGNAGVSGWLRGVAFRADLDEFIITGQGGVILTTSDGITFKQVTSGTSSDIECIANGGDPTQGLAAGSEGYIAASADGSTWATLVPAGSTHFRGAVIVGSTGICVGTGGAELNVYLGQAGSQAAPAATANDLYAVAVGEGVSGAPAAVAVGQGGVIIEAALQVPVTGTVTSSVWAPALGSSLTLSVDATGQPPLSYQWSLNGSPIEGAGGPSLVLSYIQAAQNGKYSVTVANELGESTSDYTLAAVYQPVIPGLVDESYNPTMDLPFLESGNLPDEVAFGSMPTFAALQADGQLIITGSTQVPTASAPVLSIMRFNTDGIPDSAFNAASARSLQRSDVTGIYAQPDGRILVSTYDAGGLIGRGPSVASIRMNSDGTLDESYTPESVPAGVVMTEDAIPAIMLNDGRYLASRNGLIVRLTANGAVDPTFVAISPAGSAFVSDSASRVLVGGGSLIFRLNPDGTPDPTFATANVGPTVLQLYLQPGGKIVYALLNNPPAPGVPTETFSRLNADGTPDPSYPGFTSGSSSTVAAAAMTPDGSLWLDVIADSPVQSPTLPITNISGNNHNGMIRIDPNGNFDPTYALDVEALNFQPTIIGAAAVGPYAEPAAISGILPASNGQWYVWGSFASFNGEPRAGLVRINPQVGAQFAKLGNISARAAAGSGSQTLIVGFVTHGFADMTMLLRGIGPGLASFGVSGVLPDPEIALYDSSGALQLANNNWGDGGNAAAIENADQEVGAFALFSGSLDAAALATLSPGSHTFEVYGNGGGAGIALAEAYDTDTSAPSFSGPRAVNFSCRSVTGSGANVLTSGFVIEGGNAKRVLIRAVGPSLASFGVAGTLADPVLTLYSSGTVIATAGPGWSADAELGSVFQDVGAFSLAAGSNDSAMSPVLSPGAYTAEVSSQSGAGGVVLLEVYEVP